MQLQIYRQDSMRTPLIGAAATLTHTSAVLQIPVQQLSAGQQAMLAIHRCRSKGQDTALAALSRLILHISCAHTYGTAGLVDRVRLCCRSLCSSWLRGSRPRWQSTAAAARVQTNKKLPGTRPCWAAMQARTPQSSRAPPWTSASGTVTS